VDPDLPVVIITGQGTLQAAIDALRLGAQDFVTKPFGLRELLAPIRRVLETTRLRREVRALRQRQREQTGYPGLVGESPAMREVLDLVRRVAVSDATVLLTGETGTGKGVIARALHEHSPRAQGPFVQLNCAAVPEPLVEVELFGSEKGAFTDAHEHRLGQVEMAQGGTLFLDEIGEMPYSAQTKVLHVLEEKTFRRVGGREDLRVDVRLVAATNRDLEQAVAEGKFRQDLFYRIHVLPIHLPPLRERGEDLLLLARHFLDGFSREWGRKFAGFSPAAEESLRRYPWPGNVRELRNAMERAVLLASGPTIEAADLSIAPRCRLQIPPGCDPLHTPLSEVERAHVLGVLKSCGGNRTRAAEILGLARETLSRKLSSWGVP
jgi:two-component system response regulator HydG